MEESLFSAVRIVAMMLSSDGEISLTERSWFVAVMNSFGANFKQRQVLRNDLRGRSLDKLEEVYECITKEEDQARLLNFLRVAMKSDGVVKPQEEAFRAQVRRLVENSRRNQEIDYSSYGKALLEHDRSIRLWTAIGEAGQFFNQRPRQYHAFSTRTALSFDIGTALFALAELLLRRNKVAMLLMGLFIAVIAMICGLIYLGQNSS